MSWQTELKSLDAGAGAATAASSASGAGESCTARSPVSRDTPGAGAAKASHSDLAGLDADGVASESSASRVAFAKAQSPRLGRCQGSRSSDELASPAMLSNGSGAFATPTKAVKAATSAAAGSSFGRPGSSPMQSEADCVLSRAPQSVASDKNFGRLSRRAYELCRSLCEASYRTTLRGKAKAISEGGPPPISRPHGRGLARAPGPGGRVDQEGRRDPPPAQLAPEDPQPRRLPQRLAGALCRQDRGDLV